MALDVHHANDFTLFERLTEVEHESDDLNNNEEQGMPRSFPNGLDVSSLKAVSSAEFRSYLDRELVDRSKKLLKIPHHLSETKVYRRTLRNKYFEAVPGSVHFSGFELGQVLKKDVRLLNISPDVARLHVVGPQTKHFSIKYTKRKRLVPGLSLDCTIEFVADEWRYYYDCVRLHCPEDETLIVPLHAYPVMSTREFPEHLKFPPVPVGLKKTRSIPLRCSAPVDFDFEIRVTEPHAAFTVEPLQGVVPAQSEVLINVTYAPTEWSTAHMRIVLHISQFNAQPLTCDITANSTPGLLRELAQRSYHDNKSKDDGTLDPRNISPVERARARRKKLGDVKGPKIVNCRREFVEYEGLQYPADPDVMFTSWGVAQVLNQEQHKLTVKHLLRMGGASAKKELTRQAKETRFEQTVRQNLADERQNQLRWQLTLGAEPMADGERAAVLAERRLAWSKYRTKRGDPDEETEKSRQTNEKRSFRNQRSLEDPQPVAEAASFDPYKNDLWLARQHALDRFAQAARAVVYRSRADRALVGVRRLVHELRFQEQDALKMTDIEYLLCEGETVRAPSPPVRLELPPSSVRQQQFVTFVHPTIKDDMAPDAHGSVEEKPIEVQVQKHVPFHPLAVAQHHVQLGYERLDVQQASSTYIAPELPRPLRAGAEDELIEISADLHMLEERLADAPADAEVPIAAEHLRADTLAPPAGMLTPADYPALHIFNPAPGLQVYESARQYAETDPDYFLSPIGLYPGKQGPLPPYQQKRHLDRQEVIRGLMSWKKFPCQGLISLAGTPSLTNVWLPRWQDPFEADMLPWSPPELLDSLPEDDRENLLQDASSSEEPTAETASLQTLTPEMIRAEFKLFDDIQPQSLRDEGAAAALQRKAAAAQPSKKGQAAPVVTQRDEIVALMSKAGAVTRYSFAETLQLRRTEIMISDHGEMENPLGKRRDVGASFDVDFMELVDRIKPYVVFKMHSDADLEALYNSAKNPNLQGIQGEELQIILNGNQYIRKFLKTDWNLDTCKILIALMDQQEDGLMQLSELRQLLRLLIYWFQVFSQYDITRMMQIEACELFNLVRNKFDLQLSSAAMIAIMRRHGRKDEHGKVMVNFESFVALAARLLAFSEMFKLRATGRTLSADAVFSYDQAIIDFINSHGRVTLEKVQAAKELPGGLDYVPVLSGATAPR